MKDSERWQRLYTEHSCTDLKRSRMSCCRLRNTRKCRVFYQCEIRATLWQYGVRYIPGTYQNGHHHRNWMFWRASCSSRRNRNVEVKSFIAQHHVSKRQDMICAWLTNVTTISDDHARMCGLQTSTQHSENIHMIRLLFSRVAALFLL